MKTLIILIALATTACGTYDLPDPSAVESGGENGDSGSGSTPTQTQDPQTTVDRPEAKSAAPATAYRKPVSSSGPTFAYGSKIRPYAEALAAAPKDYHLGTRTEILSALDSGALSGYTGQTTWTSTVADDRPDEHWTVRFNDAFPYLGYDNELFVAIYVKDAPHAGAGGHPN